MSAAWAPLEQLADWIIAALSENLVAGVFLASLVETLIPPLPTMVFLPTAGYAASRAGLEPLGAALLGIPGGAGATASALVLYAASRRLGRAAVARYLSRFGVGEKKVRRAEAWFGRHGGKAVLFGRMVPVFRELVSIPAGILGMGLARFTAYTFAGSAAWSASLIMLGYYVDSAILSEWFGT